MGIIVKQSIKGSFWSYLGVIIAFVTTSYLYPNYLSTDIVGLFALLISYSTLFGQFSLLGLPGITSRLFPHFRDEQSGHHGFLRVSFAVLTVGFLLFLAVFLTLAPWLADNNQEKSALFSDNLYLLIPITFFTMLFIQLDTYNKVLYDAIPGIFLQEFFQRFLLFAITLLYVIGWLSIQQLIWAYAAAVSLKGIIIAVILFRRGELKLTSPNGFIKQSMRKEMIDVGLFSVITGLGSMIIFSVDKIIINQILDLGKTGVYTIAFYFGTLVIIPSRPLLKISGTLIADAWAKNDLGSIREIYYKSCINQFIIGGFLFLGIWANIDNIITILGDDYSQSRWVIFFIGLGYLFDMMTGANAQIIAYSKHYRIALLFVVLLLIIVVGLLFLLTPIGGITGAAIAVSAGLFLNNFLRFLFLYRKFKLQPFSWRFLLVTGFYILLYYGQSWIPQLTLIPDILVRGATITLVTIGASLLFPFSPEIRALTKTALQFIRKK